MVELKKEIKFPGGSVVQIWEIEGQEFKFEFPVEVKEVVFPGGKHYSFRKVGQE